MSGKRILVLGATGSIGLQALEVIDASDELELVGLSARASWETLVEQARAHAVTQIALTDEDSAKLAATAWPGGSVHAGAQGLVELVLETAPDLVLNAIVGSAGLGPTIVALGEGIDLALANKESLVVGGELVTALAEATGARILPVDS
jgi:1-deoxy-D-xylulose-5-phosphate reductoisomerase